VALEQIRDLIVSSEASLILGFVMSIFQLFMSRCPFLPTITRSYQLLRLFASVYPFFLSLWFSLF